MLLLTTLAVACAETDKALAQLYRNGGLALVILAIGLALYLLGRA